MGEDINKAAGEIFHCELKNRNTTATHFKHDDLGKHILEDLEDKNGSKLGSILLPEWKK